MFYILNSLTLKSNDSQFALMMGALSQKLTLSLVCCCRKWGLRHSFDITELVEERLSTKCHSEWIRTASCESEISDTNTRTTLTSLFHYRVLAPPASTQLASTWFRSFSITKEYHLTVGGVVIAPSKRLHLVIGPRWSFACSHLLCWIWQM